MMTMTAKRMIPFDTLFKGIFLLLLVALLYDNSRMRRQNERLGNDISGLSVALSASVDTTRNAARQMRAQTATIVLSQEAANDLLKKEMRSIKEQFDIRLKGLKSYTQAGVTYTIPVAALGRDTIIYNNKEIVYYTPYGTLYTNGDSIEGAIVLRDTIRIAVSKGKREQWWKIWKKRPIVTNAFMASPDGSITELKSVLVE